MVRRGRDAPLFGSRAMTGDEWEVFFDMCDKIANMKQPTWKDKREVLTQESLARDPMEHFAEIIGWFDGTMDDE